MLKGFTLIECKLNDAPSTPGVYRMVGEDDKVLYVGKAKNLKKRLANYTKPQRLSVRISKMVSSTVNLLYTTTHTEAEALLLEANLIKELKPKYNILLRDDKSFPYIHVTSHAYPQVKKHRGMRKDKGVYFGPFASTFAVNESVMTLQKAFLLRNCSDHVFANRTRPCLQYQIKRCSAPCVDKITESNYKKLVDQARDFLSGKSRVVTDVISQEMMRESDAQNYEKAAVLRDRLRALTKVQAHQNFHVQGLKDADVLSVYQESGKTIIRIMFYRGGNHFGSQNYFPRHSVDDSPSQILAAFIGQFYEAKTMPSTLIVSEPMEEVKTLEEAFFLLKNEKVTILCPMRGDKKTLIEQAVQDAKAALHQHISKTASQRQLLKAVGDLFGLEEVPERIEVYDNSHISGTNAVGAMIVAGSEGWMKNAYRKFNIKSLDVVPGDDYAMLREVLTRRFKHGLEKDQSNLPDLVLVDGGKGQLSSAISVMEDLGVTSVPIVAIAKGPDRNAGREQFFTSDGKEFQLPLNDPTLYFLQRLRDEAHRFAIGTHRAKRKKEMVKSPLDGVPGVGPARKKALLQYFGSGKAVTEAGLKDLMEVPGISKAFATKIYEYFK